MMKLVAALLPLCAIAACAGDGSTLDEFGRPFEKPFVPGIGSKFGSVSFPSTYQGVGTFFRSFCTGCHAGGTAPRNLDLSADAAYDRLVGVPSEERPNLMRVEPGQPARSFLIIKLEGSGDLMAGGQMPLNDPARPKDEVERIRIWIEQGALKN